MASRTILAVFDSQEEAQQARDQLIELGVERGQISIANQDNQTLSTTNEHGEKGGFWAHLKEMFMPDTDRATYDESIRRGHYVLSASVSDELADEAVQQLERAGAIDMDERAGEWRASGWKGGELGETASATTAAAMRTEGEAIPIVEERLRVGKREVNRGSVRVRSFIVETPVSEQVHLREERVEIERRPVSAPTRPVAQGSPQDLLQERTIEMTESAEQAVVAKEAVVKEEVRVKKTARDRVENVEDTVRHTEVEVQDGRSGPRSPSAEKLPGQNPSR